MKQLAKTTGEVKQQVKDVEERLVETTGDVKQQVKDVVERMVETRGDLQGKYNCGDC